MQALHPIARNLPFLRKSIFRLSLIACSLFLIPRLSAQSKSTSSYLVRDYGWNYEESKPAHYILKWITNNQPDNLIPFIIDTCSEAISALRQNCQIICDKGFLNTPELPPFVEKSNTCILTRFMRIEEPCSTESVYRAIYNRYHHEVLIIEIILIPIGDLLKIQYIRFDDGGMEIGNPLFSNSDELLQPLITDEPPDAEKGSLVNQINYLPSEILDSIGSFYLVRKYSKFVLLNRNMERHSIWFNDIIHNYQDSILFTSNVIYTDQHTYEENYYVISVNNGETLEEFAAFYDFKEGIARCVKNGMYFFMHESGEFLTDKSFDIARDFNDGYAIVSIDNLFGIIDRQGEFVIPCKYERISDFAEGLFTVCVNGKYGFMDIQERKIIPPIYDGATWFHQGKAKVKIGNTWYDIDKNGRKWKN